MWHSMPRANEETLQALTDKFNSSQSDVKVTLVNQVSYDDTFTKYKAGLASGDLPDVVQLQGSDQQQMIDTQTALPASACAKADKYSFSDFLPRVLSYFTVEQDGVRDAVQHVGPGALLQQDRVHQGRPRPREAAGDARRGAQLRRRRSRPPAPVSGAPLGLKVDPGFFEHWRAMANKLFVNNEQRAQGTRDEGRVQRRHRARDLRVDEQHGQGRSRRDQPRQWHQPVRQPARHRQRQPRDGDRHRARRSGTITQVLASGSVPRRVARRRPDARPGRHRRRDSCRADRSSW